MHACSPRQRRCLLVHRCEHADVLLLGGEIDVDSVEPLVLALAEAARAGTGPVVLDLSAVEFADTSVVNVLLQARRTLGDRLRLAAPADFVMRLLRTLRLVTFFAVHSDAEAAGACTHCTEPVAVPG